MGRLIIAEKHSVAQAIATALGGGSNEDGWIRCGGDAVTWAQGHLVDLLTPDEYKERGWDRWSLDTLPLDPTGDWKWKVNRQRGADRQYRVVAGLLGSDDYGTLVNACDPDREGEGIFRRIIAYAGVRKPMLRLWVASLEEDAIRTALDSMRSEDDYQGLADAAGIRAKADWLIGMNASRAYSLVYDTRLTVGRVQTPTLAMVVDRDRQIDDHVERPFWKVTVPMGGWTLTGERFERREDAEELLRFVNMRDFLFGIYVVQRRTVHERPPHLYDLTGLQKDMSRLHGLTAARTLTALQSLYEKKLATYPRTDSQYITHDDLDTLRTLAEGPDRVDGFVRPDAVPSDPRFDLTVDDSKVAGHTAILPTRNVSHAVLDGLTSDERLTLTRVVRRMWEALADDYVHDTTLVIANVDPGWCEMHPEFDGGDRFDESVTRFTSRSDQPVSLGWRSIEPPKEDDRDDRGEEDGTSTRNVIPVNLVHGITLAPLGEASLAEGKTKPPKPFTEAMLLAAMEHASRYVEDRTLKAALEDDESHSGGIGTPATRADVIEKLVRSGYLERKGRQLRSTDAGRALVEVVAPKLRNVALTADMERRLSDVEHGNVDADDAYEVFRAFARAIPADASSNVREGRVPRKDAGRPESFGPCPRCGKDVVRKGKTWTCSSNRNGKQADGTWKRTDGCGYRIFPTIAGKSLTDAQVRRILAGRAVNVKGFTSRNGKRFDARLVADADRGVAFEFGG
ncbi:type IA DNA topoisomerase [Bifidobacterium dentium]|uniref:type IA DNA topoisomerase n=1 Tax=Bifidobacterium dentium TaxID=1689 RepID=UPI0018B08662|nr:type IA DNA topoisomerase [Bifidobacterium dentium]MBF9694391.1 topoisomerase C-terminal repeat-containing protein [Bifidobacterium dentium]